MKNFFYTLRPYQVKTNNDIRLFELAHPTGSVVVQGPTGCGKSLSIADLLTDPIPQILVTDRKVLCRQLHTDLSEWGIEHGVRAAGYAANKSASKQLVMLQTDYVRDLPPIPGCRRIIIDERHKVKGRMAHALVKKYGANASVVGFTATPSELGGVCDELIVMATVRELVEQNFLVPHIVYGPLVPDMNLLAKLRRQVNGDYAAGDVDKVIPIRGIFSRMVDSYRAHNPDELPTILFAAGVPQSLWAAQHLNSYGIPSVHVDCKNIWLDGVFLPTDDENLDLIRYKMEKGDIKIVCNRYLLREGVNWPFLKVALLATAFGSRQSYVQAVGRIFRMYPGASLATVIDCGGNWLTHPALDSDAPWDWKTPQRILASEYIDDMRDDKIPEPICCSKCTAIRVSGDTCPKCGFRSHRQSRWVFQANGKLKLVQGKYFTPKRTQDIPDQEKIWKGRLLGNRIHKPKRTCEQIYANIAREHGWCYPPRNLPGMPKTKRGWRIPVGQLTAQDLIDGEAVLS